MIVHQRFKTNIKVGKLGNLKKKGRNRRMKKKKLIKEKGKRGGGILVGASDRTNTPLRTLQHTA